jgi:hypothetical protein
MEDTLGLLDSLLVALALGARGIRERVEGSQALGIELVISELALPLARRRLRRIDHPSALRQLRRDGTRLRVIADQGLEVTVLPPLLTRRHCAARLAESGVELPPRLLEVAHQILDLSLRGVDSFLCADDGNVGLLRAQLAAVELCVQRWSRSAEPRRRPPAGLLRTGSIGGRVNGACCPPARALSSRTWRVGRSSYGSSPRRRPQAS